MFNSYRKIKKPEKDTDNGKGLFFINRNEHMDSIIANKDSDAVRGVLNTIKKKMKVLYKPSSKHKIKRHKSGTEWVSSQSSASLL